MFPESPVELPQVEIVPVTDAALSEEGRGAAAPSDHCPRFFIGRPLEFAIHSVTINED
jgi:hypothetical protein